MPKDGLLKACLELLRKPERSLNIMSAMGVIIFRGRIGIKPCVLSGKANL